MAQSKEYATLLEMRQQLRIAFKKNTVELATEFHKEGLIDDSCFEEVSQVRSFLTESEKAEEIVRKVMDSVQLSSRNYHKIIAILQRSRFYEPLVQKLKEEHGRQTGETMYSPESRELKSSLLWNNKITQESVRFLELLKYYDSRINKEEELHIIEELAPFWTMVAEIMGFESLQIRSIGRLGSGKPAEMCMRDIFLAWIRKESSGKYERTWDGLHLLLQDCLNVKLARKLHDAIESDRSNLRDASVTVERPGQPTPVQQSQPTSSGRRKKMNKHELAEWLENMGVDEDDVKKLRDEGVNEMLFLRLKEGDKFLKDVSQTFLLLLDELRAELRSLV